MLNRSWKYGVCSKKTRVAVKPMMKPVKIETALFLLPAIPLTVKYTTLLATSLVRPRFRANSGFLDLKSTLLKGVPKIDLFTFVLLAVLKKSRSL